MILGAVVTAYLLAMSLFGYVCVLAFVGLALQERRIRKATWILFSELHFLLGTAAMVALPSVAYFELKSRVSTEAVGMFGITLLVLLFVVLFLVKKLNLLLAKSNMNTEAANSQS